MHVEKNFKIKGIAIRIAAVLILGIIIWSFITYLSDTFLGQEYSSLPHFIIALITTVLTLVLIQAALKVDKTTWYQLEQKTVRANIISFLLGLFICLMLGWVEIKIQTDLNYLLLSILILLVTVFLIEALPEELIFRGYIYRYLHVIFPHWGTIILQALLFSLFAYFIGAMYSVEQLQFIPGFAIILGVLRAMSGNMWTSIGFHTAIMTATQILGPIHGHFDVNGMFTLQFFAFVLLPSVIGATVLSFIYSSHNWNEKERLN